MTGDIAQKTYENIRLCTHQDEAWILWVLWVLGSRLRGSCIASHGSKVFADFAAFCSASALLHSGGIPDWSEENTRCPTDATRATAAGAHPHTSRDTQFQQPIQRLIQLTWCEADIFLRVSWDFSGINKIDIHQVNQFNKDTKDNYPPSIDSSIDSRAISITLDSCLIGCQRYRTTGTGHQFLLGLQCKLPSQSLHVWRTWNFSVFRYGLPVLQRLSASRRIQNFAFERSSFCHCSSRDDQVLL